MTANKSTRKKKSNPSQPLTNNQSPLTSRILSGPLTTNQSPLTTIIFPHVAHLAQWHELKYALRSIERNYVGDFQIVIIGDRPDWLSDKARFIDVPYTGSSPRIDVMHKILAAINDENITDEFFWTNDDIYFVNKVTYADLCIVKAMPNDLRSRVDNIAFKTIYTNDLKATCDVLMANHLPTVNYSTHLPYRFEKQKLSALIDRFDLRSNPFLPEQLYYNVYHADQLPYYTSLDPRNNLLFCIQRPNPDWNAVQTQLRSKKWMNNSEQGMSPAFQQLLSDLFPDKSSFEL
jgi:hypothetical protein